MAFQTTYACQAVNLEGVRERLVRDLFDGSVGDNEAYGKQLKKGTYLALRLPQ